MTRLKYGLILVGLTLVVLSLALDVSFDRPDLSRLVGWAAIVLLAGAVVIRVIERKRGGGEGSGGSEGGGGSSHSADSG